jgi:hypothetical protein
MQGAARLRQALHLHVSQASASARKAVERAGVFHLHHLSSPDSPSLALSTEPLLTTPFYPHSHSRRMNAHVEAGRRYSSLMRLLCMHVRAFWIVAQGFCVKRLLHARVGCRRQRDDGVL